MRSRAIGAGSVLGALAAASASNAWLVAGHRRLTIEAIQALPADVPAFFREGAAIASEAAADPDVWRNEGAPELRDRESPEHFLDLELLRGNPLPERRSSGLHVLWREQTEPGRRRDEAPGGRSFVTESLLQPVLGVERGRRLA